MAEKPFIFISAAASTKTGMLRTVLSEIGVRVSDAFDFEPGDSLSDTTVNRISKADGVLVIYAEASTTVAFEMGIAAALKKPTLVLLDPLGTVPSFAQSQLYLRSPLKDTETLRASLTRFVQDLKVKRRRLPRSSQRRDELKKHNLITSFLQRIAEHRNTISASDIEEHLIDILRNTGVQVESKGSAADAGVDYAIWSNRLHRTIGNPILIELKSGDLDETQVASAERQLQQYVKVAGAQYAILLYLDKAGKRFGESAPTMQAILRFDLEDFLRKLRSHSFEEVLLTERNRVAHGGPQ